MRIKFKTAGTVAFWGLLAYVLPIAAIAGIVKLGMILTGP